MSNADKICAYTFPTDQPILTIDRPQTNFKHNNQKKTNCPTEKKYGTKIKLKTASKWVTLFCTLGV